MSCIRDKTDYDHIEHRLCLYIMRIDKACVRNIPYISK